MLQIFRDKSQSTFIQAIVLVIAVVFVFWGVGANMMDSNEAAIEVNGEEVSFQEYQRVYERLLSGYRQQLGGSIPEALLQNLGISDQAANQLIQQVLLRQGAIDMGLQVSLPEVQQNIQNMPEFQENNSFNLEKYKTLLAANRLTPHKFEASQRLDMLSRRGVQAIEDFATTVTIAEINDLYQQTKEAISLNFIKISPNTFTNAVTVDEEALTSWFEENKNRYKTDPKVKLKYLSFSYDAAETPDDMEKSNIKSLVFQKANDAYEGIISAGSLQEYANLHPNTPIIETEFFSRKTLPDNLDKSPAVQKTAFTLKSGELSSLIESPAGYSILYAEAVQDPELPPLDLVREQATADYTIAQSKILAEQKSAEILTLLKGGTALSDINTEPAFEIRESTLSRNTAATETNGFPQNLLLNVFSLHESNPFPEEPVLVGEDYYLYQFTGRVLPDTAKMTTEEMEQFKTQILNGKQGRILAAWMRHQEKEADIFTNRNL